MSLVGATENARPDIARLKLWGQTSRDWTTQDHIARVDVARLVLVFEKTTCAKTQKGRLKTRDLTSRDNQNCGD